MLTASAAATAAVVQLLDRLAAADNEGAKAAAAALLTSTTTVMASSGGGGGGSAVEGALDANAVCAVSYVLSTAKAKKEDDDIAPLDPSVDGAAAAAAKAAQDEFDSTALPAATGGDAKPGQTSALLPALAALKPTLPPTVGPSITVPVVPVDPPASKGAAVAVEATEGAPTAGAEANAGGKAAQEEGKEEEESLWGLSILFLTAVGGGGGGALLLLLLVIAAVVARRRRAIAATAGAAANPSMTLGLPASTYGGGAKEEGEVVEPTMSSPFYVQGVPIHKIDIATPAPRWVQQQQQQEEVPIEADRAPTLRTFLFICRGGRSSSHSSRRHPRMLRWWGRWG